MRAWNKLSASFVRSVRREGRYCDGGSLYLQAANGGKSWAFIFERDGVERAMGLGSYRDVPLALARELATDCRQHLARGLDPIEARKSGAAQRPGRARQARDLPAMHRGLSRRQREQVAQRQAPQGMACHAHSLCLSGVRQSFRCGDRQRPRGQGAGAADRRQAGDGEPRAWPDRDSARFRQGRRPPRRRQPRRQGDHRPHAAAQARKRPA